MEKYFSLVKKATAFFVITVVIASMFSVCTFAADTIKINGEAFKKGDVVTYNVMFKCDKACSGINAKVSYDENSLELDKESVNVPNMGPLAISNTDEAGFVKFIGTDVVTGMDFTEEKLMVSMSFKVKDEAVDSEIKFELTEIIDVNIENVPVESYTINESVVAGEYTGEITTLGDGDDIIEQDKKNNANNKNAIKQPMSKTTLVWLLVGALIVVAVVISVVLKFVKKSSVKSL
ncbi:MAG: hypothetical protein UE295_11210 [Acutalibacteraceae bacterium]|nr:hypothetical protein [Acutalibacteraceae bacterium]